MPGWNRRKPAARRPSTGCSKSRAAAVSLHGWWTSATRATRRADAIASSATRLSHSTRLSMAAEHVDGAALVDIAREAIREHLGLAPAAERRDPWLQQPAATFVTLRKHGELRGCIGSLDARRPLGV